MAEMLLLLAGDIKIRPSFRRKNFMWSKVMANKALNLFLAFAVGLFCFVPFSSKAGTGQGTVKQIIVVYDQGVNVAFVYMTQNVSLLSCNTQLRYVFDLSTPGG